MNILVTGGAGFIGSNLVHFLLERAESETGVHVGNVVNVDLLTYAGNRSSLADLDSDERHIFVQADILDEEKMLGLLREHSVDAVMHLAAESHVDRSIDGPEAFIQTNFVGSFRLLQAVRTYWSQLEGEKKEGFRFIHVSTDEVYGTLHENDPAFSETTPYAPNSPYSASKAGSDFLVRAYHHTYGLPVVTTNCSNNYGPFQFPEKLIPLMIQKIIRGEKLPVYGDGSNIRDWLYVEDHGRGLFCALTKGRLGETYNIGGKCEMKNIDVVHTLLNTLKEKGYDHATPELITYVKDRPGHDWRYAIDCSKIETELGWKPRETFETGMAKTVQWYLDNTRWIEEIESGKYRGERLGSA